MLTMCFFPCIVSWLGASPIFSMQPSTSWLLGATTTRFLHGVAHLEFLHINGRAPHAVAQDWLHIYINIYIYIRNGPLGIPTY